MNEAIEILLSNAQTVINREELEKKIASGRQLRIKLGVDPTRPDLTYGHMVVFNKLRQFQDLGHEAVFLIGDFTTTIGDPSGRSETRPILTTEEIRQNAQSYLDQAFKILDPERTTVRYNSEWFGQMSFADLLSLAREMTVAQLIERDDFAKRYAKRVPISLVEFLYPLIQGYDSVMLQADVELGGSDQLFNMLVGRVLQKNRGQEEQVVMCMPLIVGLDGQRKMSKSYHNYIAFNDSAKDMFGKVMSIPDETMWTYYQLLLCWSAAEISKMRDCHPMEAKKNLAELLVRRFHGDRAAAEEREAFERVFSRNELPLAMPELDVRLSCGREEADLINVLFASRLFSSKKELRRLFDQGAVKVNGQKVASDQRVVAASGVVVQVGKRQFFRII